VQAYHRDSEPKTPAIDRDDRRLHGRGGILANMLIHPSRKKGGVTGTVTFRQADQCPSAFRKYSRRSNSLE
jgi:hypothetical protein